MTTPHFRIVRIDKDGFNGRENFPQDSDIGLIVRAFAMQAIYGEGAAEFEPIDGVGGRVDPERLDDAIVFWSCVTADGRALDLVEFEIEPVAAPVGPQEFADALRACTGAIEVTVTDGDRVAVSPRADDEGGR
jgi:hypothetical protein